VSRVTGRTRASTSFGLLVLVSAVAAGAALLALACRDRPGNAGGAASAEEVRRRPALSQETRARARELYDTRCAPCHGANGEGDGPQGIVLDPLPRNYSDPAWQAGITDEQIARTIIEGGEERGFSPTMPSNRDLERRPAIVNGLVELIRGFDRAKRTSSAQ